MLNVGRVDRNNSRQNNGFIIFIFFLDWSLKIQNNNGKTGRSGGTFLVDALK